MLLMNKNNRYQFIVLIIILFGILSYKTYEQYTNLLHAQKIIVFNESKSLATFIGAFRQTYQDAVMYNHIEVTKKTMKLLPVQTISSISDKFSASMNGDIIIRTVSDRPRNPKNMANKFELDMIKIFKTKLDKESIFLENQNTYNYIEALYITKSCLKCHGKRENAILSIKEQYDKAYNYKIGDVRGVVHIEIKKENLFDDLYKDLIDNTIISIIMFIIFSILIYLLFKRIYENESTYTQELKNEVEAKTLEIQVYTQELESQNEDLDLLVKHEVKKNEKHQKILFEQSRMAQMGEMISMIAHQWRQPLGSISTTSIDLNMKLELDSFDFTNKKGIDDAKEYLSDSLNQIDSLVQGLTTTIDDFRNFYRPNRTKKKLLISTPISKAYTILEASFKAKDIVLKKDYKSKIKIEIYSNEFMQVVLNILQNSYDNFLLKDIKNRTIHIKTFDTVFYTRLEISDNGGGIEEDILKNIFDPYFSTKDERNGTGLGLYMSKVIVQEHHSGKLSVQNTEDGVCFIIEINNGNKDED